MRHKGRPETQGWLRRNTYLLLGASAWSVVLGTSLVINLSIERQSVETLALAEARVACSVLTQLDASLMTRYIHQLEVSNGIRGHITSLNPVSPKNQPDDWERTALKRFAAGAMETSKVRDIDGQSYFSLMHPLVIEQRCLQCHTGQAYKVGDILGGLSVDVPMAPLFDARRSHVRSILAGHGMMGLLGLGAWALGAHTIRRRIRERAEIKNQYRELFESSSDALFLIATDTGQIIECNSMATEIYGYDRDELLTKKSTDMSAEPEETHQRIQEAQTKPGQTFKIPLRFHRKRDGTVFPVEITARSLIREGQTVLLVSSRDITERTRAEKALQESEARYRTVFAHSTDGIVIADRASRMFRYVNPAACCILGYSEEELRTMGVADIHSKEDLPLVMAEFEAQARGDKTLSAGLPCLRKNGTIVYLDVNAVGMSIDGTECVVGFFRDITERTRAEKALQDANWRLSSTIEGTHAGTWEWNVQTGEAVFNDIFVQMVGYTLDELAPISVKTWEALTHPDDLKEVYRLVERHFAGERPDYDYECRMKHKDGHWVWVQDRGGLISRTADGKPLLMFGTHTDITARKLAEEALRESEERHRAILQTAMDGFWLVDAQGRLLEVNETYCRMSGYSTEELLAMRIADLVASETPDEVAARIQKMALSGFPHSNL